jgi:hypothetical protein
MRCVIHPDFALPEVELGHEFFLQQQNSTVFKRVTVRETQRNELLHVDPIFRRVH